MKFSIVTVSLLTFIGAVKAFEYPFPCVKTYQVTEAGETFQSVATKFNISVAQILEWTPGFSSIDVSKSNLAPGVPLCVDYIYPNAKRAVAPPLKPSGTKNVNSKQPVAKISPKQLITKKPVGKPGGKPIYKEVTKTPSKWPLVKRLNQNFKRSLKDGKAKKRGVMIEMPPVPKRPPPFWPI